MGWFLFITVMTAGFIFTMFYCDLPSQLAPKPQVNLARELAADPNNPQSLMYAMKKAVAHRPKKIKLSQEPSQSVDWGDIDQIPFTSENTKIRFQELVVGLQDDPILDVQNLNKAVSTEFSSSEFITEQIAILHVIEKIYTPIVSRNAQVLATQIFEEAPEIHPNEKKAYFLNHELLLSSYRLFLKSAPTSEDALKETVRFIQKRQSEALRSAIVEHFQEMIPDQSQSLLDELQNQGINIR